MVRLHQWPYSHIGRDWEVAFDQWPDRAAGEDKGADRLERLARVVFELIRSGSILFARTVVRFSTS